MRITGSYTIDAPREQVWEALNDIDILARVVPGCERLEQVGDHEYEGTVKIGIQAIKGTYSGRIRLVDLRVPEHYTLIASGRGGSSVIDGTGSVDLTDQGSQTLLNYGGEATIGGTLASVGQRLIEGASKKLLAQSLKALADQIALRNAPPSEAAMEAAEAVMPDQEPASDSAPVLAEPAEPAPAEPAATAMTTPPTPAAVPPRRSVILPESEQLKPEAVMRGMVDDFIHERPWLPWVIIAFLLGIVLGRKSA